MDNILYLLFNILGFIVLLISIIYINKKYKVLSLEYLLYGYIFFIIGFLLCAKIFHIILDFDYNININDSVVSLAKFLLSGYTFIGGIIGGILCLILFSKIAKIKLNDLLLLFSPSILSMYSVMKIGCYIKGCCIGINNFNIQLLESVLNGLGYILIMVFMKSKKNIIYCSSLIFGLLRFIVSFFRIYPNRYSFWFIQIFCFLLIIIGLYGLFLRKSKEKKEKLCKKG